MLSTDKDRLDYGSELAPPEGFVIDAAVATTYSLDLNALLAVPIALCFNNTLEGDLKGEKLALLEAMVQLKGKLKVFYQKGNIHYPAKFNRLFTLLEPCLEAVLPEGGAFSSFHPKLWLLRFVEGGNAKRPRVKYRLLVLSRNLTFDRSWDIALSLDGERDRANANGKDASWQALFQDLLGQCDDFEAASTLLEELPKICWDVPQPFDWLELRAGGPDYGCPVVSVNQSLSELLVVSPFIKSQGGDVAGLQVLLGDSVDSIKKSLCSRAEELNAIGEESLRGWDCYAINPAIVDGEETQALNDSDRDEVQPQNLHAKLIVREYGSYCDWLLGSANATSAALGQGGANPRNTEVMVTLGGRKKVPRPQQLLGDWKEQGLFVAHEFETLDTDDSESLVPALRQLTHRLVQANWLLSASLRDDEFGYDLSLHHDVELSEIHEGASVNVSQLDLPGRFDLLQAKPLQWQKASLSQLTAFVVVDIEIVCGGLSKKSRNLMSAELTIEGGDHRQQDLLRSMVDSPAKILNYVRLLLQTQPDKAQWYGYEKDDGNDDGGAQQELASLLSSDEPLFEQLMLASARHPEVMVRIELLMERLRESEVDIPAELSGLWRPFSAAVTTAVPRGRLKSKAKRGKRQGRV